MQRTPTRKRRRSLRAPAPDRPKGQARGQPTRLRLCRAPDHDRTRDRARRAGRCSPAHGSAASRPRDVPPRPARVIDPAWIQGLDGVLLSHFHRDHYDPRSIAAIDRSLLVIGPPGTSARARKRGFANVTELRPGESTAVGDVTVRATKASHGRVPGPSGRSRSGSSSAGALGSTSPATRTSSTR